MATQLLIYETTVPVSSTRHAQCSVEIGDTYTFTRNINSVPLMAVEFPQAAAEYAIVFAGTPHEVMPVVILGARKNENLYLSIDGSWQAKYVPAFIRRYPFVFAADNGAKTFTLCVDEAFPGLNREGRGQPLFDAAGKPSPYIENVLKFQQEYRAQFERTKAFCQKLSELDVLAPMQAQFDLVGGERLSLTGFMAVDRAKLKALNAEKLLELAQTDELELIYLHLQSVRNFNAVRERLSSPPVSADSAAA